MPTELDQKTLAKLAFTLYPFIFPGGETTVDSESLMSRIHRIRKGLLPENEFFAMLTWLGNCATIHRIDQTPMPLADPYKHFRAPDFLVFANHDNRIVPLLIEVKTSSDERLKWSETYLNSLKDFASVVNLPLLVAWKWNDMWLVVDSSHFQKIVTGYHLDYETAVKENLMCSLFGNVWIKLNDKTSFRMNAETIDTMLNPTENLIEEGIYTLRIENAGFYANDTLIQNISHECSLILFSVFSGNEVTKLQGNHVRVIFQRLEESSNFVQLTDIFLFELFLRSRTNTGLVWDEALLRGPFESSGGKFRDAIGQAGTSQFIDYYGPQMPMALPEYLKPSQLLN